VSDDVVTIDEAIALTGLSRRAVEGRVERGTLPSEKRGGRIFIQRQELYRQRLVRPDRGAVEEYVVADLLDRLERQAEEIGRLKAELERRR
jgi:hypothetical protein